MFSFNFFVDLLSEKRDTKLLIEKGNENGNTNDIRTGGRCAATQGERFAQGYCAARSEGC